MFVTTASSGSSSQQRAVGLVGLDDEPLPRAPAGVRARRAQLAADEVAGVHRRSRSSAWATIERGRRLAVRAGDGDRAPQRGELARAARRGAARAARARGRRALGVVRARSRWRRRARRRRPRGRSRRRGRRPASIPAVAQRARGTATPARSEPVTCAPSARATSARPLIPAPPIADEVQPPAGPACRSRRALDRRAAARRREQLGGDRLRPRPGRASARRRARHRGQPRRGRRAARRPRRAAARRSARRRARTTAAPRVGHPARVGGLVVGGGVRDTGRGSPGCPCAAISKTEPPARATHEVGRRAAPRRSCVDVGAQVVARRRRRAGAASA